MVLRGAVVTLTLLSFTACTTMRPIEDFSPAKVHQYVEVGEEVRIVLASGAVYDLVVTKVEADSLVGRAESGKHWRIKYDAIKSIEAEESDALKSVAAGVGITAVVLYVVAVVGALIIFDRLEDE
jgi:hypothetical protein